MFWAFWKDELILVTYDEDPATEHQTSFLAELFPNVIYFQAGPDELEN